MLESKLITGLDIDLTSYRLGKVRQPKIKELVDLPFPEYELFGIFIELESFYRMVKEQDEESEVTRLELLGVIDNSMKQAESKKIMEEKNTRYFDKFLDNKIRLSYIEKFFLSLTMFFDCKPEDISLISDKPIQIMIKDICIIDDENIYPLMLTIFKMFKIDINEVLNVEEIEWVKMTGSKREEELISYFKNKMEKDKKKKATHLCDYISYVVNFSNRDYKEILDWTYFQLIHSLEVINYIEKFDIEKRSFTHPLCEMKAEDLTDWKRETKLDLEENYYGF